MISMCTDGSAPELLEPLLDTEVVAGEDAHLECDIAPGEPTATIKWFKDDKEIYPNKKYTCHYKDEIAMLEITQADFKDGGSYRCEAFNKLGRISTECRLTVESECI